MLQPLRIPNAYAYSQTLAESPHVINGFFLASRNGNVLFDPLPLDESTARDLEELGGVSLVVVMTPSRRQAAQEIAARYACAIVAEPSHRQKIAPGMRAISLPQQRRSNEFVIAVADARTIVAGDALLGLPAGSLSLPLATEYPDAIRAALG